MKGVDFVFHLAAMVSVQESVRNPNECAEINAGGTAIVLEEAALARVKKLIFSSSAAIYGDNPIMPKIESMPAEPKSPYATSKYEGERHCCSFTDERRLATVCLRYFNVFGPYQSPRSDYAAAGDVKHSVAGVDRIQRAGFIPVCDLAGGLRATIEFFRKDMAGIKQGRHL